MSLLEVRGLGIHLRGPTGVARAVDGVDLEVGEGEAVGLVGESGAGKTILALSLLGLLPPGVGRILPGSSIRFRGEELVGAKPGRLRRLRGREIAMVFQEPMTSLNPVLTVGSQIREAVELHQGRKGREALEETRRLLVEAGIPDPDMRYRAYPHELSGGMRQRAMVAMALAGEPSLLLADEPTTALDVTIQLQILALLTGLRERRRMGMLLISHDLGLVARVCQRVLVLYAGRVVEVGSAEVILTRPQHPYTRALLGSRLSLGDRRRRARPVPGEIPEASAWPEGCRFHPRCGDAFGPCASDEPGLFPLRTPEGGLGSGDAGGAAVRCWMHRGSGEDVP